MANREGSAGGRSRFSSCPAEGQSAENKKEKRRRSDRDRGRVVHNQLPQRVQELFADMIPGKLLTTMKEQLIDFDFRRAGLTPHAVKCPVVGVTEPGIASVMLVVAKVEVQASGG